MAVGALPTLLFTRWGFPMGATGTDKLSDNVTARHNLKPGDVGYLIYLHGVLYATEYGWDHTFEAYVAGPLAEFAKSHSDREQIWVVEQDGEVVGSVAIVKASEDQAQLRWLLLHPSLRRCGVGRVLVEEAIRFCRNRDYATVFLWTVSDLTAAVNLYRSVGFQLAEEKTHGLWGTVLTEQRYDLVL